MGFIKGAWRLLMVVKDALVLLFLIGFFIAIYAAISMVRPAPAPARGALYVSLDGALVEQPAGSDPLSVIGAPESAPEYRLRDVVHAVETAAGDDAIKAVVIDLSRFTGTGHVAGQRLGAAMDKVRRAGKPVLTYAVQYDDSGYQIAAHASEVWLSPFGFVAIAGPGGSQLYYKGLIDRLGVTTHIYRVGTYKSFVEPYIRADQSPPAKEAAQALASSLWSNWIANVHGARPKAQVAAYAADPMLVARDFKGDAAKAALSRGLVDKLGDDYGFNDRVTEIAGADPENDGTYASIPLEDYLRRHPASRDQGKVGVVTVAGEIVDGEAGPGSAGGDSIAALIDNALADDKIKALVVRVDSPGGSVTAAEAIRQSVMQARKAGLPVVISMGNVAASGGYWISTAGQKIYAEPSTITGSIGVFGILPSFEGTLAKIGVTSDGVRTTPLSGEPDVTGGVSPAFNAIAQSTVEHVYRQFVGLVASARHLPVDQAEKIAEGRVWDGGSARQLRLVDAFGGLDDAVAEAARRAKLTGTDARPRWLDPTLDPVSQFLGSVSARAGTKARPAALDWLTLQSRRREQAAQGALVQARAMLSGSAIRADCLECRGLGGPPSTVAKAGANGGIWGWLGAWLNAR
ncbi:signal peptide peptidase SppA [Sphingobium sufflavum]|uniref:signal peptide peptidase SppA n=1 Tax=Sphingobium sufflavum TaxID=1129547 RepID=UPI001F15C296|nr:signal peptide peptidase SppA [Sphingobium sufflavum]MCE7795686.1 signal peptide peptidase SppA [Sphingobium sufflavum]